MGLSDFRVAHPELLKRLLTEHVAALSVADVIDLDEVVQDGVRVRASAGRKSFRRKKKLHKELKKATRLVERLKQEAEDDPAGSNRRIAAAQERAAREREARVERGACQARPRSSRAGAAEQDQQEEDRQAGGAACLHHRSRSPRHEDGRRRLPAGLQLPDRHRRRRARSSIAVDAVTVGSDRGLIRPMLDESSGAMADCPSAISSMAASTRTTTPNGLQAQASRSTDRPPRTSTRPIPTPRALMTVPALPTGAGA